MLGPISAPRKVRKKLVLQPVPRKSETLDKCFNIFPSLGDAWSWEFSSTCSLLNLGEGLWQVNAINFPTGLIQLVLCLSGVQMSQLFSGLLTNGTGLGIVELVSLLEERGLKTFYSAVTDVQG